MLTIRQYNKIMHDWVVLLTGLNGSYVRPQKNEFGFSLTNNDGSPISFNGLVAMFYFGFSSEAQDLYFDDVDSVAQLKTGVISITFVGEDCQQYSNALQANALSETSRTYLESQGFAIQGKPDEIQSDVEYSSKWFYRRTVTAEFNISLDFIPPTIGFGSHILDVPLTVDKWQMNIPRPEGLTLNVVPSVEEQIFIADKEYYSEVIVSATPLQEKEIHILDNGVTVVEPDADYIGLSKVTITTSDVIDNNDYARIYDMMNAINGVRQLDESDYTTEKTDYISGILNNLTGV